MQSSINSLNALAACAGSWRGTNRLYDPHTNAPEDSPTTLSVTPVLGGRFLRVDYTWAYQGTPQEGSLLLGADPENGDLMAYWADTWHMDRKVMVCHRAVGEGIAVRGSYAAPPGPDWDWRIEIMPVDGRSLRVLMFNLSPDGQSHPAAEASYTREPAPSAASRAANTERRLEEIGQIAVTVSDVGKALHFYRDVLGLKFLFSPGPNLAFLAAGAVRLMLSAPEGAGKIGGNSILYFKVTDVEAVHTAVVQRGAASERPPQLAARMPDHDLWIGFVRDPDGNLIGLMEEKRRSA